MLAIKFGEMGNVLAATALPPSPPPPLSPSPTLWPNVEKQDSSVGMYTNSEASDYPENPGTIEDLHKKCKGMCTV